MQFKETYNHLRVERNYTCTSDGDTTFPVVVVVVDDEVVVVVVVRATGIDAGSMPRSRSVACAWSCADEVLRDASDRRGPITPALCEQRARS